VFIKNYKLVFNKHNTARGTCRIWTSCYTSWQSKRYGVPFN